jgi:hypothetical protein
MPRVFAITTPAPTISLEPSGRGEVPFTVSNSTATPMRVRASLQPSDLLKREWLSLRGAPVRKLPAGSTEVFIVDIQVPPGTPPSRYTFCLVAADNELPDERFSEGPTVSVAVSAPAAAPARGIPWWLIAMGVVALGGGAIAAFLALSGGEPPECPVGQTLCAGECADLQADTQNRSRCGGSCGLDQSCQASVCQCSQGLALCGDACVSRQGVSHLDGTVDSSSCESRRTLPAKPSGARWDGWIRTDSQTSSPVHGSLAGRHQPFDSGAAQVLRMHRGGCNVCGREPLPTPHGGWLGACNTLRDARE